LTPVHALASIRLTSTAPQAGNTRTEAADHASVAPTTTGVYCARFFAESKIMMRKLFVAVLTVIVLVIAAAAAAPWYIGKQVQARFTHALTQLAQRSPWPLELQSYQRHWLD